MCNTGKSFGQKMHCGRVCEAILGRLWGVGWCCRGHRVGRWPAGPEAGWRRVAVAPFRLPRNALCHSCFPPSCGADLQNGRRWRAKRALRQPETGPVAWPCGGVAPLAPPCAARPAAIRWGRGHREQALRRRRSVVFVTFLQADANFSRKSFGVSEKVITFAPAYKKRGRLAQLV